MKITAANYLAFAFAGAWIAWILGAFGWFVISTIAAVVANPPFLGVVVLIGWWLALGARS